MSKKTSFTLRDLELLNQDKKHDYIYFLGIPLISFTKQSDPLSL